MDETITQQNYKHLLHTIGYLEGEMCKLLAKIGILESKMEAVYAELIYVQYHFVDNKNSSDKLTTKKSCDKDNTSNGKFLNYPEALMAMMEGKILENTSFDRLLFKMDTNGKIVFKCTALYPALNDGWDVDEGTNEDIRVCQWKVWEGK